MFGFGITRNDHAGTDQGTRRSAREYSAQIVNGPVECSSRCSACVCNVNSVQIKWQARYRRNSIISCDTRPSNASRPLSRITHGFDILRTIIIVGVTNVYDVLVIWCKNQLFTRSYDQIKRTVRYYGFRGF